VIKDAKNARKSATEANRDLRFEEFCSTIEKTILEMRKEIWSAVVTTICPHEGCKYKSPAIKRDGYTKLFIKPIAAKTQNVREQRTRIEVNAGALSDDGASTVTKLTSRTQRTSLDIKDGDGFSEGRPQTTEQTHEEVSEVSEDEDISAAPQSTKQEYIRPDKVLKHLEKLFEAEEALLGLLYGRFDPANKANYHTDTQGYKAFFLNLVVVPPTRFRPESEGAVGGQGKGSAYLHTHSTMLLKVIQTNYNLSRSITDSMKNEEEKAEDAANNIKKYSSGVNQQWIQL
jgi:hypothetical protein